MCLLFECSSLRFPGLPFRWNFRRVFFTYSRSPTCQGLLGPIGIQGNTTGADERSTHRLQELERRGLRGSHHDGAHARDQHPPEGRLQEHFVWPGNLRFWNIIGIYDLNRKKIFQVPTYIFSYLTLSLRLIGSVFWHFSKGPWFESCRVLALLFSNSLIIYVSFNRSLCRGATWLFSFKLA